MYECYNIVPFSVVLGSDGDCYDRYLVRLFEMFQSLKIVDYCCDFLIENSFFYSGPSKDFSFSTFFKELSNSLKVSDSFTDADLDVIFFFIQSVFVSFFQNVQLNENFNSMKEFLFFFYINSSSTFHDFHINMENNFSKNILQNKKCFSTFFFNNFDSNLNYIHDFCVKLFFPDNLSLSFKEHLYFLVNQGFFLHFCTSFFEENAFFKFHDLLFSSFLNKKYSSFFTTRFFNIAVKFIFDFSFEYSMESLIEHFLSKVEGCGISGDAYISTECPKGEFGIFLRGSSFTTPLRLRIRAPGFFHLQALRFLSQGHQLTDLVTILGSIDLVLGEVDR